VVSFGPPFLRRKARDFFHAGFHGNRQLVKLVGDNANFFYGDAAGTVVPELSGWHRSTWRCCVRRTFSRIFLKQNLFEIQTEIG